MTATVPVDYTDKDYTSFREAMLDNASKPGAAGYLPAWTARGEDDFGVMMVEKFAYLADIVTYYIDRLVQESFIETAVLPDSVQAKARLLDYHPDLGVAAKTNLTFTLGPGTGTATIPAGTQVTGLPTDETVVDCDPLTFETDADVTIALNPSSNTSSPGIPATEGITVNGEQQGQSDGSANQEFDLIESPVISGSIQVMVDEGGTPVPWTYIDHLVNARSDDAVFTTYQRGEATTTVQFGDGVNGRVPLSDALISATYRVGGGIVGNSISTDTVLTIASLLPFNVTQVTSDGASGGSDPESVDSIRVNVSKSFSTQHRCVTLADYANACLGLTGVSKAVAQGTSYTNIRVYALGPDYALLSIENKAAVVSYLQDKKMVNSVVSVADGVPTGVSVTVSVVVGSQYNQTVVASSVHNAIYDLLSFGANDFGGRITTSAVYGAVAAIDGVSRATVDLLDLAGGSGNADVQMGVYQIAQPATITVNVSGGLTPTGSTSASIVPVTPGTPGTPTLVSLSCPTTGPSHPLGGYQLDIAWTAAANALAYAVILDFYAGSTLLGSQSGGVYAAGTTTANITGAYASTTADHVHVRVRAINGTNTTDSLPLVTTYTCGTNPAI